MKRIIKIVFVSFCILLFYACNKCKKYAITKEEKTFINYEAGMKTIFKNNLNGLFDTLIVENKNDEGYCLSCNCKDIYSGLSSFHILWHDTVVDAFMIRIDHDQPLKISGVAISSNSPQTITVNGKSYTDVYSASVDSNSMSPSTKPHAWKIDYSKSNGIVRLYYLQGLVRSRL